MKLSLVAIGSAGTRIAEGLLHCAFCGALRREDVIRVTLICAPAEEVARLRSLYAGYAELRSAWGLTPHMGLAPILSLRGLELNGSLASLASDPPDAALLRCLYPAAEVNAPAASASPAAASAYWACALEKPSGVMAEVLADGAQMPTVLCASLSEPSGAAGVEQLARRLKGESTAALLLTNLTQGEDTAPARRFLEGTRLEPVFLAMAGLPDDCTAPDSRPHLAHLLLIRALDAFMTGARGDYGFRVPTKLDWHALDPEGEQWGAALDRLLRFDALWNCAFAPEILKALREGPGARDRRHPWLQPFLKGIGSNAMRDEALRQTVRGADLAHAGACWLRCVQQSLPFVLRPSPLLEEARQRAAEHYEQILKRAGQLALLDYDIDQIGMAPRTVIHRHDMDDSEDETAVMQREAVRDALQLDIAQQAEYDRRQGGRVRLNSLRETAARTRQEAESLRQQAAEARRLIDRAAANARPADLSRVDMARTRLRRMERRLASLEGRAAQAARDAAEASAQDARTRPPMLDGQSEAPADVFWPAGWLDMLCGLPAQEPAERARTAQSVLTWWPWPRVPARQVIEQAARVKGPQAVPALRLIDVVMYLCGPEAPRGGPGR